MKKSRFSEQQIAFILRQAEEGTRVEEVCRKAGISEATYYNWRKKYGGLMPSEMKWTEPSALRTLTPPGCLLRETAVISLTLPPAHGRLRSGRLCGGGQNRADGLNRSGIGLFGAACV